MSRTRPWLVGALGLLLLVAGVVVFALANSAGFGWTAYTGSYAPLAPDAYSSSLTLTLSDGVVLWTRGHALGAGLAAAGLMVLVGLGGWLLGRRGAHPRPDCGAARVSCGSAAPLVQVHHRLPVVPGQLHHVHPAVGEAAVPRVEDHPGRPAGCAHHLWQLELSRARCEGGGPYRRVGLRRVGPDGCLGRSGPIRNRFGSNLPDLRRSPGVTGGVNRA